jgi:adenylate cyclase class 2
VIEAEYKARLMEPDTVRARLRERTEPQLVTYEDTYFDDDKRTLSSSDQELRIRTITGRNSKRHVLTFKDTAVDQATGSKPEHETTVSDRAPVEYLLKKLGYLPFISFSKICENYRFTSRDREILATVATVPELDGTYLELETQAGNESDLTAVLADLRSILYDLSITASDLTTELYTDAVARKRSDS